MQIVRDPHNEAEQFRQQIKANPPRNLELAKQSELLEQ